MIHRRNVAPYKLAPPSRASEPADENRDINENLASPLVGLAALRESLPGLGTFLYSHFRLKSFIIFLY